MMHRDNHYVSRGYLKRWTSDGSKLWAYRVLVSDERVPQWREVSTRGIAYHEHLYTKIAAWGESDEVERWLESEFETPAEQAIEKVISDRPLTSADWRLLARFFAAQDVRTPARLVESIERWAAFLPELIQTSLRESVAQLEAMPPAARAAFPKGFRPSNDLPFRVSVEKNEGEPGGLLRAETFSGRALWLWGMRHQLTHTLRELYRHHWTILAPPEGETWYTSDDPVLKVNFNSLTDYTFGGGWGRVGTDLLLPLGPRHLLFTQIGKRVPPRGTRMETEKAMVVRKLIAEHAHRYIFASAPDSFVATMRPRTVDAAELKRENKEWQRWHAEQTAAELSLMVGTNRTFNAAPKAKGKKEPPSEPFGGD
jgi:hypothetical protein